MSTASSAGLLVVTVGSFRSTSNGPNAAVGVEFPATSDTARATIESDPSPLVDKTNDASPGSSRPDVASLPVHGTVTAVVYQPFFPSVPAGAPQATLGATVSMWNGPNGPATVVFPALSFTARDGVESAPSPVVSSMNDASAAFAKPDPASLAVHAYDTSDVYQPFAPIVPCGPAQDTTGGTRSLPCTTWNVTKVAVSSRSVDPVPGGVVVVVCRRIT